MRQHLVETAKIGLSVLAVACVLGLVGLAFLREEPSAVQRPATIDREVGAVEANRLRGASLPSSFSSHLLAYAGADGMQHYEFGGRWDVEDPHHLVLFNSSAGWRDVFTPEPYEALQFSASFEIVAVDAKTRDHFYLGGSMLVDDVVERWKRGNVAVPGGGGYVLKRSELYRGSLGGIRCLGVDHMARFLLVVHGSNPTYISRIGLPSGGTPVVIYSSEQFAAIGMVRPTLFVKRHATQGIVWTLESDTSESSVVFIDVDDDGQFDAVNVYTPWAYASAFGLHADWLDDFTGD